MRLSGALLLIAAVLPSAHGQFFDFLADWSDAPPTDSRGLTADITATLKAKSPWGEISTVESGKYWRNSKGQDRFDDSYGLSTMRDRRGPLIRAKIDRQLHLTEIEERTASRQPADLRADPWNILPFNHGKVDPRKADKIVEGLKVSVRTGEDHGVSYEAWTSDELGLVLYLRYKTDSTVFEQRVHNIRFTEPAADTVALRAPADFRTRITCWSPTDTEYEAPRQTYEPGRELCK